MKHVNIMPCLDIKDGRVVKGVKFVDLRDAADPVEAAVFYEQSGADAIAFLDIAATVEKRLPIFGILAAVASAVKTPITVGGGFKSVAEIGEAIDLGVSAVSISSAAFRDPGFIGEAVRLFGGGRIVIAIDTDVNKALPSGREVVIDGGRTYTGRDAAEFAAAMRDLGVGAILPTSKNADGSLDGYDIEGIRRIVDATGLPVIASGGAGKLEHFLAAARDGGASTLLAASVFHFGTFTIRQVKEYLRRNGVDVNL